MKKALIILALFGALIAIAKNDHGTTFLGANLFSGTNTVGAGGSFVTSGGGTIAATTAAALAANGANCSAGNYPLGVDASGAVESCTSVGSGGGMTYPIGTELHWYDDFTHPSTTTATMGWVYANGSLAIQAAEANHPGLLRRSTGAGGSGVVAYISRAAGNNQTFLPADNFTIQWLVRINTDNNQTVRAGANCGAISAAQPAAGAYFEATNSGNWFAVNRTGSAEAGTNQDTTIDMATATWYLLGIRRSSSNLIFSINGTDRITQSGNMPTAVCTPWAMITNSAFEDKTMDLDAVSLDITGLTRY